MAIVERQGEAHCLDERSFGLPSTRSCLKVRLTSLVSPFPDLKNRFVIVPPSKECFWEMRSE